MSRAQSTWHESEAKTRYFTGNDRLMMVNDGPKMAEKLVDKLVEDALLMIADDG